MASLVQKKLHFHSTIENEHSIDTSIESVNCKLVNLPNLPLPSEDFIELNFSATNSITVTVTADYTNGKQIFVDYGDGLRDTHDAETHGTATYHAINKTFSESVERKIVIFGSALKGLQAGSSYLQTATVNGMSSLTTANSMFAGSTALTSIDMTNWDSSNVTSFVSTFANCMSLEHLDVSTLDTSSAQTMQSMFRYCNKLTTLDVSNFDVSSVYDMSYMFSYLFRIKNFDLSNWNTQSVTNMSYMFQMSGGILPQGYGSDNETGTVVFGENFNTENVINMSYMFNASAFKSLDLSQFNTSNVKYMGRMFACQYLENLNVSSFNTENVLDMSHMFQGTRFQSLDLSHFNTRKVTNMSYMFQACYFLNSLNINSFDTRNVSSMKWMFQSSFLTNETFSNFQNAGYSHLPSSPNSTDNNVTLDLSNWDVRRVSDMDNCFENCERLASVNFDNWCVPFVFTVPDNWNNNEVNKYAFDYKAVPFTESPVWGSSECAYCCPSVNEYLNTSGTDSETSYEVTDDNGNKRLALVYTGFDAGGKLCVNLNLSSGYSFNTSESFKNVSIDGVIVGTIKKILQNGSENNEIYYTTGNDLCYVGEYSDGDTIIMSEDVGPTPTPIMSDVVDSSNLCEYEYGRNYDFSKTSICVRKEERDSYGLPNTTGRYLKVDGEYVFDGMENGKPKYRMENEYGIGTIAYSENYKANYASYYLDFDVKEPYHTLAANEGASRGLRTNAGSYLQPTDFYNYTKLKNKEYPWCHWTTIDPVPYTLATEDNPCDFPTPTSTSISESTPTPTELLVQTTLTSNVTAGDTQLQVVEGEQTKFSIGDKIVIDEGTNKEEYNEIDSFSSINLVNPLLYDHQVGASVKKVTDISQIPTPTPTQSFYNGDNNGGGGSNELETRKFYVHGDPISYDTYAMTQGKFENTTYLWSPEYREFSDQDAPSLYVGKPSPGDTLYIDYVHDMDTIPFRLAEIDNNGNITYSLDAISQGFNYSISLSDIYTFEEGTEDEESAVREITLTEVPENTPTPTSADYLPASTPTSADYLNNGVTFSRSSNLDETAFMDYVLYNGTYYYFYNTYTVAYNIERNTNGVSFSTDNYITTIVYVSSDGGIYQIGQIQDGNLTMNTGWSIQFNGNTDLMPGGFAVTSVTIYGPDSIVSVSTPTPTPLDLGGGQWGDGQYASCVEFSDSNKWLGTSSVCFSTIENQLRFSDLRIDTSTKPSYFSGDADVSWAIVKKDALDSTLDIDNMLYDETSTFGFSSDLYDYQSWLNDVNPNAIYTANQYLNANLNTEFRIFSFVGNNNQFSDFANWVGTDTVVLIAIIGDYNGTTYGPGSRRILETIEFPLNTNGGGDNNGNDENTPTPTFATYYVDDSNFESVTTTMTSTVVEGATTIQIPSEMVSLFNVGEKVVIAEGTSKEEYNEIVGWGSLVLAWPLKYSHNSDTEIKTISEQKFVSNFWFSVEKVQIKLDDSTPLTLILNNLKVNTEDAPEWLSNDGWVTYMIVKDSVSTSELADKFNNWDYSNWFSYGDSMCVSDAGVYNSNCNLVNYNEYLTQSSPLTVGHQHYAVNTPDCFANTFYSWKGSDEVKVGIIFNTRGSQSNGWQNTNNLALMLSVEII